MTQPCDSCGQPSPEPTCLRCRAEQGRIAGYLAWSNGAPRPETGRRHEQRVDETRKHLGELPDLYAQLALFRLPGSVPQDPDGKRSKANPAWRSVVNLDVLDLTDTRDKSAADPTRTDYGLDARAGQRRQGVINTLASWSRLVEEERRTDDPTRFLATNVELAEEPTITSECRYLLAHLDWISEQQWFDDELHPDVRTMWVDVRHAIGERDRHVDRFACPKCGNDAVLVAGGFLSCTASTEHDVSVRDLEGQYRRRPALSTKDICEDFRVSKEQLWQWKARRKIQPVNPSERTHRWLPWDVFCLVNPDLRAAIDMRDAAEAV